MADGANATRCDGCGGGGLRDLFAERERLLMSAYQPKGKAGSRGASSAIPRMLTFHEYYPFFQAFSELGFSLLLRRPPRGDRPAGRFRGGQRRLLPYPGGGARTCGVDGGRPCWKARPGPCWSPSLRETFPTAEAHPYADSLQLHPVSFPDLVNEAFKLEASAQILLIPSGAAFPHGAGAGAARTGTYGGVPRRLFKGGGAARLR